MAQFLDRGLGAHGLAGDADVSALLSELRSLFADQICVVLLYGSYLRGAKDTLLDFYVVVEDYHHALGSRLAAGSAFSHAAERVLPLVTHRAKTVAHRAKRCAGQIRGGEPAATATPGAFPASVFLGAAYPTV